MEQVLCEPVELTEFELDAVAGGNPFSINISAFFSDVDARIRADVQNEPTTLVSVAVNNSLNIIGS
jgi:hypothetical protein